MFRKNPFYQVFILLGTTHYEKIPLKLPQKVALAPLPFFSFSRLIWLSPQGSVLVGIIIVQRKNIIGKGNIRVSTRNSSVSFGPNYGGEYLALGHLIRKYNELA